MAVAQKRGMPKMNPGKWKPAVLPLLVHFEPHPHAHIDLTEAGRTIRPFQGLTPWFQWVTHTGETPAKKRFMNRRNALLSGEEESWGRELTVTGPLEPDSQGDVSSK